MAKHSSAEAKTKKKATKKSGPDAISMKLKAPKANPFETIWSRRKFDILGKKHKGEERRIGLARSLAIQKRKKTLLKEYEQSTKSSVFVDKRIGEQDDDLGEFEKGILRSQRERQLKFGKKSKFNLSDGEEDEFDAQDLGSLPERDDFENEMLSDDDNEDDEKRPAILKQLNVHGVQSLSEGGLMEGEENKHKSKKEIMEEVILKSKFFKAQKARDKEENEQLMEELDKDFTSLVQSKVLLSLTEPAKMNALKALLNKSIPDEHVKKEEIPATQRAETSKQEQPDSYDKLVNEMVLDMRARPSDRTKTSEEIAQEERERLERLEEERQKRMLSMDYSSDEDGENAVKDSVQRPRAISGDDLGDSFALDEEPGSKGGWVDEILGREDADNFENEDEDASEDSRGAEDTDEDEGSEEDENECEKTLSLKDWEQSDDDDVATDLDEDEDNEEHNEAIGDENVEKRGHNKSNKSENSKEDESVDAKKIKSGVKHTSTKADIPFIIEAPKSLEELSSLLLNCSNNDVVVIINRIRASNAIKLAAENRKKMQVFYGVLLQYFAVLANKKPLNFELSNLLVKPLLEMSMEIPFFSAICARERILRTRIQFCEALKNQESGCWPTLKTLFLLRLWSMIFPCSDYRHVVTTPALLLMCEYLMRCPITLGRDVVIGSFLCSMILMFTKQSRKFCPEAIMFLRTLLMATTDQKLASEQDSQFYHLMELKTLRPLLCIHDGVDDINPLNLLMVMEMSDDSPFFSSDSFRASALVTVIETLRGFVEIYDGLSSFPEIFLPIATLLQEVSQQKLMPDALKDRFNDVSQLIKKKAGETQTLRRPLQLRKQKPLPIKLVNPKFEENFVKGRDYDPDRERAERKKLQKLIKREAKGAARELRKDNHFLYEAKQRAKELLEQERAANYGKAIAFLQDQEHAFKSGQLGKGSRKRKR
ncbi:Adenine nucleotide alpha hydrolases-like superfamily protein isoform 1 [Hibiscus syriacus]|uniref:Adenine nucleotide alpha hydrolases-like superfamily protein isoform 1 n=1 Tax=Hibiscus syriacus TaxID=106335 RepID=A0A6A2Z5S6_HIBSY|nr:nucleolar protein 14-like [Hibiscus syriacus]XP_039019046.1 nucleolar protein 14-like [Hibiscus syriacus]KAE8687351.1 Adenine nucleotide alpha hydrolases-like superfamily protein isoform 1 [Hibiscus syriacus]